MSVNTVCCHYFSLPIVLTTQLKQLLWVSITIWLVLWTRDMSTFWRYSASLQRSIPWTFSGKLSIECLLLKERLLLEWSNILVVEEYAKDVPDICSRHTMLHHLFADSMQGQSSGLFDGVPVMISQLERCITDVSHWCACKQLQLNADKTEVLWFGSTSHLRQLHQLPPDSTHSRTLSFTRVPLLPQSDSVICQSVTSQCVSLA